VKTISLKKVSAVAVAALAIGTFTAIAPANAALTIAANQALTGTAGTSGNYVVAGTAATIVNTESTTTAATSGAFKITNPSGTVYYVGSDYANATVGTSVTAARVTTLTLATTFLSVTGKYTVASALGLAADLNTLDLVTTGTAAGTAVTSSFFVYKTTPSYSGGTARVVTAATAVSQDVNGTATLNIVSDDTSASYTVTTSGVGSMTTAFGNNAGKTSTALTATTGDTVTFNNGTTAAGGVTWTPAVARKSFLQVQVSAAVAGATVVSVTPLNSSGTPGTPVTASVTWGATPAAGTQYSTVYLNAGTTQATSGNDDTVSGVSCAKTVATQCANIAFALADAAGNAISGQALTVTMTGPGTIGLDVSNAAAGSLTYTTASQGRGLSSTAMTGAVGAIAIWPDGTAGTATITIASGTTTIGSKSVTFYGSASKITATQNYSIARASAAGAELGNSLTNTSATTGYVAAVSLLVTDGTNAVPSAPSCKIADTAVIASCTIAADNDATYGAGLGYYNASVTSSPNGVSGKSTTVTFRILNSDGLTYTTSDPVTFTLGGSIVSTSVTLDKTSYAAGDPMVLTVTTKDSAGNPSYDGQAILGSIGINKTQGGSLPAVTKVFAKGKYATSATAPTLFAPVATGAFTISGVSVGTTAAPLGVAYSVSASVTDANSGLLTQIDALNAKIVALNALIAKIMKKLGVK